MKRGEEESEGGQRGRGEQRGREVRIRWRERGEEGE